MLCDFVFPIIRLAKFFTKLARSSPGPRLMLPGVRALCSSIVTKEAVVSMEDQKARDGGEKAASREQHPVEIPLKSAGEAVFIYKKELVKSPRRSAFTHVGLCLRFLRRPTKILNRVS